MTDPHRRLQDALDALDTAFAPFCEQPFPRGGCTYCYSDADLDALAGPAHQVPEELLALVTLESPGHWDDFPALYRRLTPRILRLLTARRLHVDHALVASRLLAAAWHDWPAPERAAVEDLWQAWWHSTLHEYPGHQSATGALEVLAVTTGTLTPWLTTWTETRTEAANRHLADALDDWLFEDRLVDLHLGFYGELPATAQLLPWLLSLDEPRAGTTTLAEVKRIAYG